MRSRLAAAALVLAGTAAAQGIDDRPERRVRDPELQAAINDAISGGVQHLRATQTAGGCWVYDRGGRRAGETERGSEDASGGLTALALYALAAASVPAEHDSIRRGLGWVAAHPGPFAEDARYGVYSASLLVMALTRIDATAHRKRIWALAQALVAAQLRTGLWDYWLDRNRTTVAGAPLGRMTIGQAAPNPGDNSNTQLAVLALWTAQTATGFQVPHKTWERVRAHFTGTQQPEGGWTYKAPQTTARGRAAGMRVTRTMTAAGLVSSVCALAALGGGVKGLADARAEVVVERGLAAFLNGQSAWTYDDYYFVYAIERTGTLLDLPLATWYPRGARALVDAQRADGRWTVPLERGRPAAPSHGDAAQVYETALAMLFLSRATEHPITPRR